MVQSISLLYHMPQVTWFQIISHWLSDCSGSPILSLRCNSKHVVTLYGDYGMVIGSEVINVLSVTDSQSNAFSSGGPKLMNHSLTPSFLVVFPFIGK